MCRLSEKSLFQIFDYLVSFLKKLHTGYVRFVPFFLRYQTENLFFDEIIDKESLLDLTVYVRFLGIVVGQCLT